MVAFVAGSISLTGVSFERGHLGVGMVLFAHGGPCMVEAIGH
jgi:hypothetical protein